MARAQIEYQTAPGKNLLMPTECLFRDDSYLKECEARVLGVSDKGIVLDRTVFYAMSGGQPADAGVLITKSGEEIPITGVAYLDAGKTEIAHAAALATVAAGDTVVARI